MIPFVAIGLWATLTTAIPTIQTKGNKFFTSDGAQFFVKGVAYQLLPDESLADPNQCLRDATLMKELGANAIRVYHVDPKKSHSGCMNAFAENGIYAFVDMDTFSTYILGDQPTWTDRQYDKYAAVMDEFQRYDNLAGLFIGNEVINQAGQSGAAPYIKAAVRDMKGYRDAQNYRNIPIGYSAADIAELRPMLQNYLACGNNAGDSIDFFSLNSYEWCGDVNFQSSGYDNLNRMAKGYPVPIFFSETGCNTAPPRTFADQAAIFGDKMSEYWSGSIVYEWIQETNNYGLVSYAANDPDGLVRTGTPTPVVPDFDNLKSQWATDIPSSTSMNAYKAQVTPPPCPDYTAGMWLVSGDVALPTLSEQYSSRVASALPLGPNASPYTLYHPESAPDPTPVKANPGKSAETQSSDAANPTYSLALVSVALAAVTAFFMFL